MVDRFTQYHARVQHDKKAQPTGGAGVPQDSVRRGDSDPSRVRELPSIIARELRITGKVVSDGVVHVEGVVDGEIQCAELVVGAGGGVFGHISAERVYVRGEVAGTIRAKAVRIGRGSIVRAEVVHETLIVEHGARLDGYYRSVKTVDVASSVDIRSHMGRPAAARSALPRRNPSESPEKGRRPVTLRPPREATANPLH